MKKCFFSWKETVLVRIGWFRARFWWVKILKWSKGGTKGCNACGPPFGLDHNFKNWKPCFSNEKMLLLMKGNSFSKNRMVSSKILMSENFEMEQRGDQRMQCMWSPLWSWPQLQKLKNLFFKWKNASSHERKQFCKNRMVSSKILMSENFEMEQRGDQRMQCMWSPLWSWPQLQKLKTLFFKWKNASSHERKQF